MSLIDKGEGGFGERIDWALFISVALLAVIGVVNLYSATSVYTQSRADMYVSQVYFLAAGSALAVFVTFIDYRHFERFAYILYGLGQMSLVLVLALGKGVRGSSRWINLGGFGFQPSEFTKIWLILALARYFHDSPRSEGPKYLRELIVPTAIMAVPALLVLKQPDLGTALIHGLIFVSIVALQRIRTWSLVLLAVGSSAGTYLFWNFGMKEYQKERITSFIAPETDITGTGYHAYHARIAIGNGGFLGQGFAKGSQNQYYFLPDQYSDFPFSVLSEDWGFVGCAVLLALYMFVVLWAVRIASQAKDRFGAVVAIGVGSLIFWHATFNIGMVSGVLPVVGVTLPLMSYGGSSLLTVMLGIGLLMNVSIRRPHLAPLQNRPLMFGR